MAKIGSVTLTEGQQYDKIDNIKINDLFLALEEIRKKFKGSISGTYSSTSFNTNVAQEEEEIDNSYISLIKTYLQVIETSKYVPSSYSTQITIPKAEDYIEVGKYYNNYIDIFTSAYNNCPHDSYCNHCDYYPCYTPSCYSCWSGNGWGTDGGACPSNPK